MRSLSPTEKTRLLQDLGQWAVEYNYNSYYDTICASIMDDNMDYWPYCTMKDNIVVESNGDVYPCFTKKTPVVGDITNSDLGDKVNEFWGSYRCRCSTDQCITQFQHKDPVEIFYEPQTL